MVVEQLLTVVMCHLASEVVLSRLEVLAPRLEVLEPLMLLQRSQVSEVLLLRGPSVASASVVKEVAAQALLLRVLADLVHQPEPLSSRALAVLRQLVHAEVRQEAAPWVVDTVHSLPRTGPINKPLNTIQLAHR